MTKKDYKLIAEAVAASRRVAANGDAVLYVSEFLGKLCDALREDNPRFASGLFLSACEKGKVTS